MTMHNPPHPGEFIKEVYLEPLNVTPRSIALQLKVSPSTFSRLIKGQSAISPEMALRLSKCLGRSPESWLRMQDSYDLWQARQNIDLSEIEPLSVPA
ncbi:MAG: HigA family addiction module antidote protein [Proteobacteria bacterium]|nr:HigA family addiction module antidote protein [Pseudomonadota bacterium]MBU1387346.1 HigA family addiction module antidote protein [Pseudomonadota bacterium]MBU1541631.1 HigA family addiction module antidote protein [Pseudomonadota bacterium]MBU2430956.1 HigA family addiction module antidote protein [Pseudomonadota bacterium]MBU2482070.1 HigA family addiction module antidote protein [Pseudomonadota bacterium]